MIRQKAPESKSAKVATPATTEEQRLVRAPEAVEENIIRPVEADLVNISHRPRRRKSGALAVVSLGTWPETVPRNELTIMMVHYRLQGWVVSGVTTAQDGTHGQRLCVRAEW